MKTTVWAAAVLGLAASFAAGQEMVDNPAYKQWSAFKAGTMVKVQATTTVTVAENEIVNKSTTTTTLKELTAEKAVIEIAVEVEVNGQKSEMPAQTREIPAKLPKAPTGEPGTQPDLKVTKTEGDEEVELGGKKYKCHWVEVKTAGENQDSTVKTWTSTEIPGGLVKMVMEQTKPMKMKTTQAVVEFKAGA